MKTYQYDTTGDILNELRDVKRLLEVIAGVKPLKEYQAEEEWKKTLEREYK